jgi:hypothetical protein
MPPIAGKHGEQHREAQALEQALAVRRIATSRNETDGNVELITLEIRPVVAGDHANIDARVRQIEPRQSRRKPQ